MIDLWGKAIMKIKNHRLVGKDGQAVPYERSPNQSGKLDPTYLIMHFTAGSSARSSIEHLKNPSAKASAHLVIGRDGSIVQLVPFDRVAWHAGRSRWHELRGLNRHSIGIELDNAGELSGEPGRWTAWFGTVYPDDQVAIATHQYDAGPSAWQEYTEVQIAAALEAATAIVAHYGLIDVLGHDDIAPDRKRDPGPAFPLAQFKSRLLGRADEPEPLFVCAANLNIRSGPGVDFEKVRPEALAKGTKVRLEGREGVWCYVEVLDATGAPDLTGWVHGNYLARSG